MGVVKLEVPSVCWPSVSGHKVSQAIFILKRSKQFLFVTHARSFCNEVLDLVLLCLTCAPVIKHCCPMRMGLDPADPYRPKIWLHMFSLAGISLLPILLTLRSTSPGLINPWHFTSSWRCWGTSTFLLPAQGTGLFLLARVCVCAIQLKALSRLLLSTYIQSEETLCQKGLIEAQATELVRLLHVKVCAVLVWTPHFRLQAPS